MTNPTTPEDRIDEVIFGIVEKYSSMERGKTIGAHSFPEARHALLALLNEARLDVQQYMLNEIVDVYAQGQDMGEALDFYADQLRAATPKEEQ